MPFSLVRISSVWTSRLRFSSKAWTPICRNGGTSSSSASSPSAALPLICPARRSFHLYKSYSLIGCCSKATKLFTSRLLTARTARTRFARGSLLFSLAIARESSRRFRCCGGGRVGGGQ
eukprot:scaffold7352_cov254-Pinguiococcus_pyrenoidosus.AAC.40